MNYTTEAVDFHYKGLHYFPPNLINFNNIKIIILSENFIKKIPSVISKISDNLVYLDVSKNRIKKISWEIGTVKKLRILNLSFNNIYEFPKELCLLTELTYLDLKDNHISSLPPEIGKLVNLCKLDLDNNELTSLPDELLHLSNLRYLSIQGNKLSKEEKENVSIMLPNCKINF